MLHAPQLFASLVSSAQYRKLFVSQLVKPAAHVGTQNFSTHMRLVGQTLPHTLQLFESDEVSAQ